MINNFKQFESAGNETITYYIQYQDDNSIYYCTDDANEIEDMLMYYLEDYYGIGEIENLVLNSDYVDVQYWFFNFKDSDPNDSIHIYIKKLKTYKSIKRNNKRKEFNL